ncbi:hypothetical protein NP493_652g00011 [Ridgeia piscesae]|uniref:Uncharacterized protein n=1 Tax=Ridgeia piscesae TaxID=27915 RepID=A0AAD9KSM7_RIDPI|nr:hypothetical protein NP493_652g00011 [Ridgeia piscesae]
MAAVKKLLVVFAICCLFVAFVAASGDDDDDDDDVTVAPPPVRWLVGASLVMVDHFEIDISVKHFAIYCVYDRGYGKIRLKLNSKGPVQKVVNNACVRCFDCMAWGMHCEEFADMYVPYSPVQSYISSTRLHIETATMCACTV